MMPHINVCRHVFQTVVSRSTPLLHNGDVVQDCAITPSSLHHRRELASSTSARPSVVVRRCRPTRDLLVTYINRARCQSFLLPPVATTLPRQRRKKHTSRRRCGNSSALFSSRPRDPRVGHTTNVLSPFIPASF